MDSLQFSFEGYALVGMTLAIMALVTLVFILLQRERSAPARWLAAFYAGVTLAGLTMVLTNSLVYWDDLFAPWQDFWVLAAGVALVRYAYALPGEKQGRQAAVASALAVVIALAALAFCLHFSYQAVYQQPVFPTVPDTYYLLLPLGIVLAVAVFLLRSIALSRRDARDAATATAWLCLAFPRGEYALLLRDMALALSLGLLPAVGFLVELPYQVNFVIQHFGALLAVACMALVYFTRAPEVTSFMARLVGSTLLAVLLLLSTIGNYHYESLKHAYDNDSATLPAGIWLPPEYVAAKTTSNSIASAPTSQKDHTHYLSAVTVWWMGVVAAGTLLVLLVFPALFRRTLVAPVQQLLAGVRQANTGALDTRVPVSFPDEIGQLTHAFNQLAHTLQESYGELEHRVAARTDELSTFLELTRLPGIGGELGDSLQTALERIQIGGHCDALCLHLVPEHGRDLELAAAISIPPMAREALRNIPLDIAFAERLRNPGEPIAFTGSGARPTLPPILKLASFGSYLGVDLGTGGRTPGWISCYRKDATAFGEAELALLGALARQVGIIIENHHLQRRIGRLAAIEERQRLARDLHDSVSQLMYGITLFSRAAKDAAEDGNLAQVKANVAKVSDTARQALREMRSLLFELQPPPLQEHGLAGSLERRLDTVERRAGIHVEVELDPSLQLEPEVATALYYVAIEALNNSLKYARASQLCVTLGRNADNLGMVIADDGDGFDPARPAKGMGLDNIRQRVEGMGGCFELSTGPGSGTRIAVTIPLREKWAANE